MKLMLVMMGILAGGSAMAADCDYAVAREALLRAIRNGLVDMSSGTITFEVNQANRDERDFTTSIDFDRGAGPISLIDLRSRVVDFKGCKVRAVR